MNSASGTRERIIEAARAIVRSGGPGKLTFDAVAGRLGLSKQAVIYWFPKKEDLIAGVALPLLRDEAEAGLSAIQAAEDASAAIRAFVQAVGKFHFVDLDRFRLMYVAPQTGTRPTVTMVGALGEQVHALTSSMYDALQMQFADLAGLTGVEARRAAVAAHMAVLGVAMMVALTQAMGDPLLHDQNDLLDTLAKLLSRPA
jgi:AcrR family transcriptional regulator